MHEGGCYCGRTRFTVREIFDCVYCHCTECRKLSGAPVFASVVARKDDFELRGEAPKSYPRTNGAHYFCPNCGSEIYYQLTGGEHVSVSLGAFDRPETLPARAHQFWPHKLPWLALNDDLPKFDANTLSHPDTRKI